MERVQFRDVDSYILDREIAAVKTWLDEESFAFHVMRDHPRHQTPVLPGLWAANNYVNLERAQRLRSLIFSELRKTDDKHHDQKVLQDKIWPLVKDSTLRHDSYFCQDFGYYSHYITYTVLPAHKGHYGYFQ